MTNTNSTTLSKNARQAFLNYLGVKGLAKTEILDSIIHHLDSFKDKIITENKKDLKQAEVEGLSTALIDRLRLDESRLEKIKQAVREIKILPDPVGQIEYSNHSPEGLVIQQERVPIGVVLIIFESRPNIVPEIAALCLKSGNACILRGGKEAIYSNKVLGDMLNSSLNAVGVNPNLVQVVNTPDRGLFSNLLKEKDDIDLVVPRGGKGLIEFVSQNSSIPVVKHDDGICHTYIHQDAEKQMAINVAKNAKIGRPGVCNAMETLLIHLDFSHIEEVLLSLHQEQVEIRADAELHQKYPFTKLAVDEDWRTEYLDKILSVKQIAGLDEAINWINEYGSNHSDAIITSSLDAANYFQNKVDSACVFVNASTRFADGGCFGLGAEVGISTQKLHARGPMGVKDLTSLKYKVSGQGQIRI